MEVQPTVETSTERHGRPFVSVIVPAYKAAPYIAEALDSVFAQTYTDYEIVVVDDGSPDTVELERVLAPYRARILFVQQPNAGPSAARNRGIRESRGELIAFLDADDAWAPSYLEEQVAFLEAHPDTDAVYADAQLVGASKLAGRTFMSAFPSVGDVTFENLLHRRCTVITSGAVVRRQPLLDVGLFDEELRAAEDYHLWLRLISRGHRMRYQRKVLLSYRLRGDSLTSDALGLRRSVLASLQKLRTGKMTPSELRALRRCEARTRAEQELELAKHALASGDMQTSRQALREASRAWWPEQRRLAAKLLLVRWSLRLAPSLTRRVYLWRELRDTQALAS